MKVPSAATGSPRRRARWPRWAALRPALVQPLPGRPGSHLPAPRCAGCDPHTAEETGTGAVPGSPRGVKPPPALQKAPHGGTGKTPSPEWRTEVTRKIVHGRKRPQRHLPRAHQSWAPTQVLALPAAPQAGDPFPSLLHQPCPPRTEHLSLQSARAEVLTPERAAPERGLRR